jgi:hypothetical protein
VKIDLNHTVIGHKFVPKKCFANNLCFSLKTTVFHEAGVNLFLNMISCNNYHLHQILLNFMRIGIKHA